MCSHQCRHGKNALKHEVPNIVRIITIHKNIRTISDKKTLEILKNKYNCSNVILVVVRKRLKYFFIFF